MSIKYLLSLLALVPFFSTEQALAAVFEKEVFEHKVNGSSSKLPYRILLPVNFSSEQQYPVVFFLHGAGERGSDNEAQLTHGASLFMSDTFRSKHQVIAIFPQAPEEDYWVNVDVDREPDPNIYNFKVDAPLTPAMSMLLGLIDEVSNFEYVDNEHMMIMGLSMGGMGTLEVLAQRPGKFSSAISICGGAHPGLINKMDTNIPLWILHGDKDDVVPYSASEIVVDAYKKAGGRVKFTTYEGVMHNSWENAFAEPNLLDWLINT